IDARIDAALVEEGFCPGRLLGWRQEHERQVIGALAMSPFFLELSRPFGAPQRRYRIGKRAGRIAPGRKPARFDEDRPARSEPAQRIVEPRRDTDQLGGRGAFEVGSAEVSSALKAAVLVENDALFDERRPWQEVREVLRLVTILGE